MDRFPIAWRSIALTSHLHDVALRFGFRYFPRYRSASTSSEKAGEGWRRLA